MAGCATDYALKDLEEYDATRECMEHGTIHFIKRDKVIFALIWVTNQK